MTTLMTADQVLADYSADRRNFRGITLAGGSYLSLADLSHADFTGADLCGAYFEGADLRLCTFTDARLICTSFARTDLTLARFTNAVVDRTAFDSAILSGADFTGVSLGAATFYNARLSGALIARAKTLRMSSHELIAEALRQAAGTDVTKRQVAGLVLISLDWCWGNFEVVARDCWDAPTRRWIAETLLRWPRTFRGALVHHGFISREDVVALAGVDDDSDFAY